MILEELKSLRWLDFFYYALIDPRSLYRLIRRNEPRPLALSFIVPAMVAIIEIITFSIMTRQSPFFYHKITSGWILVFLFFSLRIVVSASLMDLCAQFLGHKGNARDMVSLVNFAHFPGVFILPIMYIFKVFHYSHQFFYIFCTMALFVWTAMIAVQGISEMHSTPPGKSLLIFFFPYLFVGIILFLISILVSLLIAGFFGG